MYEEEARRKQMTIFRTAIYRRKPTTSSLEMHLLALKLLGNEECKLEVRIASTND